MLRWCARSGRLDADDARDMLDWDNGGFSLDAAVRIGQNDRAGLERLEPVNAPHVVYPLPKPRRDCRPALSLSPLELIDNLAALIPPPRLHRHRYHGVLAPNSPLRAAATAYGRAAGHAHEPPASSLRNALPTHPVCPLRHATGGPCGSRAYSSPCR